MKLFLLSVSLFAAACASRGTEPALPPGSLRPMGFIKGVEPSNIGTRRDMHQRLVAIPHGQPPDAARTQRSFI